ncbi:response regulator [Pseudooceanicola sp.]|uniref:response regulator n=1 Tax=Pseudooceanicola sp. TaxID=1914328 RepID=UPI0040580BD9
MTAPPDQTAAVPSPSPDFRAILLDDSECDRRHAARIFARIGLPLDTEAEVDGFFRRIGGHPYRLALIDHHLGAETGLDVLARLAARDDAPETLVLLTGAEDPRVAEQAMALGATCLGKDRLRVTEMAELVARARGENGG